MAVAVAVEIAPPESNPPLFTEAQKSKQTFLVPLKIPRAIMSKLALNSYSTLADLDDFGHKEFEYFCSAKIRQDLYRGGTNYSDKFIKHLQGLVLRASEIKRIN